jgi:hypothetical protein
MRGIIMGGVQYVKPKSSRCGCKGKGNCAKGAGAAVNTVMKVSFALGIAPSNPLEDRYMRRCVRI